MCGANQKAKQPANYPLEAHGIKRFVLKTQKFSIDSSKLCLVYKKNSKSQSKHNVNNFFSQHTATHRYLRCMLIMLLMSIIFAAPVKVEQWNCTLCDTMNEDAECQSCGEFKQIISGKILTISCAKIVVLETIKKCCFVLFYFTAERPNATMVSTSDVCQTQTSSLIIGPTQFNAFASYDDYDMTEINREEDETILFSGNATFYCFVKNVNEWRKYGCGKTEIVNSASNQGYIILHRQGESSPCFRQFIHSNTAYDDTQITDGVLAWAGRNVLNQGAEEEKYAVKFNEIEMCKTFHNVILIETSAISKKDQEKEVDIHRILQYATKEPAEAFALRCATAHKLHKIQNIMRSIQTWNDVNVSLGITTESRKRHYERICQNIQGVPLAASGCQPPTRTLTDN